MLVCPTRGLHCPVQVQVVVLRTGAAGKRSKNLCSCFSWSPYYNDNTVLPGTHRQSSWEQWKQKKNQTQWQTLSSCRGMTCTEGSYTQSSAGPLIKVKLINQVIFIYDMAADLLKHCWYHREEDHRYKHCFLVQTYIQHGWFLTREGLSRTCCGGWTGDWLWITLQTVKTVKKNPKHSNRQPNIRHGGRSFYRQETSFRINLQLCGIVKFQIHPRDHMLLHGVK